MDYVGVGAIHCCQRRSYRIVGVGPLGLSLRRRGVEAIDSVGIGKCGDGSLAVNDGDGAVGV